VASSRRRSASSRAASLFADLVDSTALSARMDREDLRELRLIEVFCGASVVVDHLNARILSGATIDNALVSAYAQVASAMVRVANKLGTQPEGQACARPRHLPGHCARALGPSALSVMTLSVMRISRSTLNQTSLWNETKDQHAGNAGGARASRSCAGTWDSR
jgi:hypothetical protein